MEYTDLIADFARRTVQNLDHVNEQALRGNADVYPVTQFWNSLLGLIVLPRERDMGRIPSTPMTQLWSQGWPRLTTAGTEHETLRDFVNGLRNAVAHWNVEFIAGSDREINSVKVWNQKFSRGRPAPGRRWEGRATVEDLDRLARLIANLYVEKFASTAAWGCRCGSLRVPGEQCGVATSALGELRPAATASTPTHLGGAGD